MRNPAVPINQPRDPRFLKGITCCLCLLLAAGAAYPLTPADVVIVANASSPDSLSIAERYRQLRAIPQANVCALPLPMEETVDRQTFDEAIRGPLRQWLSAHPRGGQITCLLLSYDVPLRIQSDYGQSWVRIRVRELDRLLDTLEDEDPNSERLTKLLDERKRLLRIGRSDIASVDSELTLLRTPHVLQGRLPNPLFGTDPSPPAAVRLPEGGVMTARLDGPTPQLAMGLAEKAIAAERQRPAGHVYIDARGLSHGQYAPYDDALRRAYRYFLGGPYPAHLENTKRLFGDGECPNALLYYGWYRRGKFRDAFDWAPGAVAVHLASSEARSLRNGDYWCPRLIADGVTATLGPVAEPYADAFPPPDLFFRHLAKGQYTLVESYFLCLPHLSWRMVLVGDPLYRPFKLQPYTGAP
jgi:uncharacterized protein (TIGR03790 family)